VPGAQAHSLHRLHRYVRRTEGGRPWRQWASGGHLLERQQFGGRHESRGVNHGV
jgi:hypothetical protein